MKNLFILPLVALFLLSCANAPKTGQGAAIGGAGGQPERAPEHSEHREAAGREVSRGQIDHGVAAQCGQGGRDADPRHAATRDRPVNAGT